MLQAALTLIVLLAGTAASAQSTADFAPFHPLESNPAIVLLNGTIDARTPLAFRRVLSARPQTNILVLNSPGGDVQAALLVAEDVFERKISTLILDDSGCYSACALIYFAGAERVAEGELGVHQISGSVDVQAAQLNLSDIIEYLSKYGVSAEVITRMLRTPPDDMYVFNQAEITALGINRLLPEENPQVAGSAPEPPSIPAADPTPTAEQSSPSAKPEDRAQAFVLGLIMAGSLPKSDLLATAKSFYSDTVTFYGKSLTQADVLADKARYADRWPVRVATARAPTLRTSCYGLICRVTGLYDWSVSDPQRKASANGSAEFEYLIDLGNGYKVIEENGKVLKRN